MEVYQILTICYVIMLFILRENRIGFPMTTLTPDNMVGFIKVSPENEPLE